MRIFHAFDPMPCNAPIPTRPPTAHGTGILNALVQFHVAPKKRINVSAIAPSATANRIQCAQIGLTTLTFLLMRPPRRKNKKPQLCSTAQLRRSYDDEPTGSQFLTARYLITCLTRSGSCHFLWSGFHPCTATRNYLWYGGH